MKRGLPNTPPPPARMEYPLTREGIDTYFHQYAERLLNHPRQSAGRDCLLALFLGEEFMERHAYALSCEGRGL